MYSRGFPRADQALVVGEALLLAVKGWTLVQRDGAPTGKQFSQSRRRRV